MHIKTEMDLHINYCKSFGIGKEEIEGTEEHQGTYRAPFFNPNAYCWISE
jgi:hypothetical protein